MDVRSPTFDWTLEFGSSDAKALDIRSPTFDAKALAPRSPSLKPWILKIRYIRPQMLKHWIFEVRPSMPELRSSTVFRGFSGVSQNPSKSTFSQWIRRFLNDLVLNWSREPFFWISVWCPRTPPDVKMELKLHLYSITWVISTPKPGF